MSAVLTSIGFCPTKPRETIGVTAMVTPILHSFEPVVVASKQLLYGVRPDGRAFSYTIGRSDTAV